MTFRLYNVLFPPQKFVFKLAIKLKFRGVDPQKFACDWSDTQLDTHDSSPEVKNFDL